MDASLVSLSAFGAALIPVIIGLCQIIKSFLNDARWIPLSAIVLGIIGSFVSPASSIGLTILQGILIGLAASGLFSTVKTTAGN